MNLCDASLQKLVKTCLQIINEIASEIRLDVSHGLKTWYRHNSFYERVDLSYRGKCLEQKTDKPKKKEAKH